MSHKVLVIVLDGASFVFCNLFLWYMDNVKWFFHQFNRNMLYIDDIPITPTVLHNFFTGKYSSEHGVLGFKSLDKPCVILGEYKGKYVWDIAIEKRLKVRILNVPVKIPPININVYLGDMNWVDMWLPPRDNFETMVDRFHNLVIYNVSKEWDLFVVWYPIPDQAHHHFFPTVGDFNNLRKAFYWYDKAFRFARHVLEVAKPRYWLVVSDHGFSSDFEEFTFYGIKQHVHVRDGLVISNTKDLPRKPVDVFYWIRKYLGV